MRFEVFMKYLYKISVFMMILFFGAGIVFSNASEPQVEVLSSSDNGCTIAFMPSPFRIDTVAVDENLYQRLDFDLAGFSGKPGDPMVPCRVLVVGVPLEGDVSIALSDVEFEEKHNIRLLPVPETKEEKGLPVELYREGEGYRISEFMPQALYHMESPSMWGKQRIVRIFVYPVQFNPKTNRVRLYTRMVIDVRFRGGDRKKQIWNRSRNESLYQKALINYSTAKKWRIESKPKVRRLQKVTQVGKRYKIPVTQEGIYKVTGSFLKGQGIDIGSIDPKTLKIYNNGGRQLPRSLSQSRPDSLIENPILLSGTEDGHFDESDYFLFYGKGVNDWAFDPNEARFSHYMNVYTTENIYWLGFNDQKEGLRITAANTLSSQNAVMQDRFLDHQFYEKDMYIHPGTKGGILWYGRLFTNEMSSGTYSFTFPDAISSDTLKLRFQFQAATYNSHYFSVSIDGQSVGQISFSRPSGGENTATLSVTGINISGTKTLSLIYSGAGEAPHVYLDWIEVEYKRQLKPSAGKLRVFSTRAAGLYDYHLSGFSGEPVVLDVTDPAKIRRMPVRSMTDGWAFVDSVQANSPRIYALVQTSGYLSPLSAEEDVVSDLRNLGNGADLILITHRDFYESAVKYKSYRESTDSLSVSVVDIQDVFDEFSWGLYDPVAIRDFVKYAYDNWNVSPSFLLLMGDGDYDYRNLLSTGDENWVPPFEYDESTSESGTRASDDWYTYVSGSDYNMDLAVGRFPVRSNTESEIVVDKIIQYESNPDFGEWRNTVTLVGDDEIGENKKEESHIHINALEDIARRYLPSLFNLKKVYLTEYPSVPVVDRNLKPQAQKDLIEQFNRGTLFMDYIGHGNEELWAHEWVFKRDRDLPLLENGERLPLIYAATCAFGWFDNYEEQSFSEELLYANNKGAAAVISASRFSSATENESLNKQFIGYLFNESGPAQRIGEALQLAKIQNSARENREMYLLFGDPAMRLGVPRYDAVITEMEPDSIKALSVLTVKGQIEKEGQVWNDFDGKIALRSFDSKRSVVYKTGLGREIDYLLPGNSLFRGEAQVQNGEFQIAFVVPKDISYGTQTGRFSLYFWNEQSDGCGARDSIHVGGSSDIVDQDGPEIKIVFSEDEDFVSGGMVYEEPELIVLIKDDKTGINITGDIGHKIMLTLDQQQEEDITDYFQYSEGSYLDGKLQYPLEGISEGKHELLIKAWDNANNSASSTVVFDVVPFEELRIENVLNYPNPLSSTTHFTFQLNHQADIEIKIYTVSGRLIRKIEAYGEHGFNMIYWDGRDEMGDELANGVYLYKVAAKANIDGENVNQSVIERLIMMR